MGFVGAGPYIPAQPSPLVPVSPVEMLALLLRRDLSPEIVPSINAGIQAVWVGGAEEPAQQAGCVILTVGGLVSLNPHMPIQDQRIQVRCIAHQYSVAEQIGQHVKDLLHVRHRETIVQPSSGNEWLIHRTQCIGGPSVHWDTATTWESLAFYEVMVGTTPVS